MLKFNKILREEIEKQDDFGWINDTGTDIGSDAYFNESNICFDDCSDDYDCEVCFTDDAVYYHLDMSSNYDGPKALQNEIGEYDWHYIESAIQYGYSAGDGDYHEYDYDEFNYFGHQLDDTQRQRLANIVRTLNPNIENPLQPLQQDQFNDYFALLKCPTLKNMLETTSESILYEMGVAVTQNRWKGIVDAIDDWQEKTGIKLESSRYYNKFSITVPMKLYGSYMASNSNPTPLGFLENSIPMDFIVGNDWDQWWYDEYSTEGSEDEVEYIFNKFLDDVEEYLEDGDHEECLEEIEEIESKGWEYSDSSSSGYGLYTQSGLFTRPSKMYPKQLVWVLHYNLVKDEVVNVYISKTNQIHSKWNSLGEIPHQWHEGDVSSVKSATQKFESDWRKYAKKSPSDAGIEPELRDTI